MSEEEPPEDAKAPDEVLSHYAKIETRFVSTYYWPRQIARELIALREEANFNAAMLAKQCDLAREAETNPVRIGRFLVANLNGAIWIHHAVGTPLAGEGGQFNESDLEAVIAEFYRENF